MYQCICICGILIFIHDGSLTGSKVNGRRDYAHAKPVKAHSDVINIHVADRSRRYLFCGSTFVLCCSVYFLCNSCSSHNSVPLEANVCSFRIITSLTFRQFIT